jgi:hypothetical protein
MSGRDRGYPAGFVVLRSVGFGFLGGGVLGVAGLVILSVPPWHVDSAWEFVGDLVLLGVYAAIAGSVIGSLVGLFCGAVLVAAGPTVTGARRRLRVVAGVAAGTPITAVAAWQVMSWGSRTWSLGGWLWWLVVAAMSAATGAAIGPHVVGGPADPIAPRHCWIRHCRRTRSLRLV